MRHVRRFNVDLTHCPYSLSLLCRKTLQTLSLVCHLKEHWKQSGPSLVICPLSVLYSWGNEATKWAPSLKCLRFHSSQADTLAQQSFEDYDVVITTYEMVSTGHLSRLWSRQFFNLVVLDEGHRIKCAKTLISQAVRKLHSECRIILTGYVFFQYFIIFALKRHR